MLQPIREWYARFERPISSLSLIGGFVFDVIALPRVGELRENLWVLAHIVILAVAIILINREDDEEQTEKTKSHRFWLENILQFFFGGLLSVFLVFYFRSTTLSVTWPFLLILVIAFIANERLKREQSLMGFQIALFYLSIVSFSIFLTPLFLHSIGTTTFLLSIVGSFIVMMIFLKILRSIAKDRYERQKHFVWLAIFGISITITVLYAGNLIPPIPLSLKDAGLYHSVEKNSAGDYVLGGEHIGWKGFFNIYDGFHEVAGDPVFAYSAIFSPGALNITIIHEWQFYNETTKAWETRGSVTLSVLGGRDQGFRTYSEQTNLEAGKWRVNVKTTSGAIIGRIYGRIIPVTTEPTLSSVIK